MFNDDSEMVFFRALMLWSFNVEAEEKFKVAYAHLAVVSDAYRAEKTRDIRDLSLAAWVGTLDYASQERVAEAVLEKYGAEARRWVAASKGGA